jgi:methionyl aminopeptidase
MSKKAKMKDDGNYLDDVENEAITKTLEAGKIVREVREEAVKKVKVGESLLSIAEFVENAIVEKGGMPAFPCNVSINEQAAHATPGVNDSSLFKEGDLVKLDIGAHIDGYIADTAVTVDLGDNENLLKAAEEALKKAIEAIEAGVETTYLGEIIETTILDFNVRPVVNLTGHGLLPYIQHAPPTIYNKKLERGAKIEEGMVIAIEPFATNGVGKVGDISKVEIYSLLKMKPLRMPVERKLLKEIEKYKTLPFARRWIQTEKADFALKRLVAQKVIKEYPVLAEISGGLVSQAEHTVIVEEGGCKQVT